MIEFGKITGKIENNLVQVKLRMGESLYAPIITNGTNVSIPTDKWISDNKDNFLAVVTYEGDAFINPMIIGFYPVSGASSSNYNTHERLLAAVTSLLEQLLKAKVNTLIGPQPFMPDTLKVFNSIKSELDEIKKLVQPLKL